MGGHIRRAIPQATLELLALPGSVACLGTRAPCLYRSPRRRATLTPPPPPHPLCTSTAATGASGAVNAIIMFYTLTYPFRSIYVYGLIPVPAWMLGVVTLGRNFLDIGHADRTPSMGSAAAPARFGRRMRAAELPSPSYTL